MNVEKIITNLERKVNGAKKIKVMTFTRKHFKDTLSTSMGIGFQDMKKKPKKIVQTLVNKGYDIFVEPVDVNNMTLDLYVILK